MSDSNRRRGGAADKDSFLRGNEAVVVIGLFAVAIFSAYMVVRASIDEGEGASPQESTPGETALPERIPYEDLVSGRVTRFDDGRVSFAYDFEAIPKVEGRVFAEVDLYPQLEDWNLAIPGSRVRTGIVRGEGRLTGEARSRLAFEGPLELHVELELLSGTCALQVSTNRAQEGYEIRIEAKGAVSVYVTPAAKGRRKKGDEAPEPVKLAGPTEDDETLVGRVVALAVVRDEETLRVVAHGREIIAAKLLDPAEFPAGNVALRTTGKAYWDNVRVVGTLGTAWLEDRLYTAVSLISRDMYERDNSWTTAREILPDGRTQNRTLHPAGDVDWVSVAVLGDESSVSLRIEEVRFGIVPELQLYEVDGATHIEGVETRRDASGTLSLTVTTDSRKAFYVKITGKENRVGTYTLRVVGGG